MQLTYPAFLWALCALAIPILIHLFNLRRYKRIHFTNVRLLKEIEFETKSRSKIKRWLILLSRLGVILALVFAFTLPFLPDKSASAVKNTQEQHVSIYLDNSFSMAVDERPESALNLAKNAAQSIAEGYGPGSQFRLVTNEFKGSDFLKMSGEQLVDRLSQIDNSPIFRKQPVQLPAKTT